MAEEMEIEEKLAGSWIMELNELLQELKAKWELFEEERNLKIKRD
jgi:hypothetical protein